MHGNNNNTTNNTENGSSDKMVFRAEKVNKDIEKTVWFYRIQYMGKHTNVSNLREVFDFVKGIREKEDAFILGIKVGFIVHIDLNPYKVVCTDNCIGYDRRYCLAE